jgi:hypothetical protein
MIAMVHNNDNDDNNAPGLRPRNTDSIPAPVSSPSMAPKHPARNDNDDNNDNDYDNDGNDDDNNNANHNKDNNSGGGGMVAAAKAAGNERVNGCMGACDDKSGCRTTTQQPTK